MPQYTDDYEPEDFDDEVPSHTNPLINDNPDLQFHLIGIAQAAIQAHLGHYPHVAEGNLKIRIEQLLESSLRSGAFKSTAQFNREDILFAYAVLASDWGLYQTYHRVTEIVDKHYPYLKHEMLDQTEDSLNENARRIYDEHSLRLELWLITEEDGGRLARCSYTYESL